MSFGACFVGLGWVFWVFFWGGFEFLFFNFGAYLKAGIFDLCKPTVWWHRERQGTACIQACFNEAKGAFGKYFVIPAQMLISKCLLRVPDEYSGSVKN